MLAPDAPDMRQKILVVFGFSSQFPNGLCRFAFLHQSPWQETICYCNKLKDCANKWLVS